MELGLTWDDDLFECKDKKVKSHKQKPYNVKICEKEYFFKNPSPEDEVQKQNIIKFQADFWYRSGDYPKALDAYLFIHKNPQVKSTTVERDIDESIIRCYLKLGNISSALASLSNVIKKQGGDTSLFLLLAEICSATGHMQGEITCFKRCISLHSYNHNFWYSLARCYSKTEQLVTNTKSPNKDFKHIIDSLLQSNNTAKSYKECLKLMVKCCHCKCTNDLVLLDTTYINIIDKEAISAIKSVQVSSPSTQEMIACNRHCCSKPATSLTGAGIADDLNRKLTIEGSCCCKEKSSCTARDSSKEFNGLTSYILQSGDMNKNQIVGGEKLDVYASHSTLSVQTKEPSKLNDVQNTNTEASSKFSSSRKTSISNDQTEMSQIHHHKSLLTVAVCNSDSERTMLVESEVPYLVVGQEDAGNCSFNMAIMKTSSNGLYNCHITRKSTKHGLALLTFFCLLRTRFLLQRAIWTSVSFVKEKLSKTMDDVKEDINKCVLCQCGELRKCILKQMELEDASLTGQNLEDLDMHSLYQGGGQKHWT